jgi:ribosomal protein S27AE
MAEEVKPVEEKKVKERKGKKPRSKSKHKNLEFWKKYKNGKFSGRWCPRCGAGTALAHHNNRVTCGKCHYAEIKK